jgi:maleylpyruvate isomerase
VYPLSCIRKACHEPGTVATVNDDHVDEPEIRRAIEACLTSHTALDTHLRSIDPVDPTLPTVLEGWTVGHVLTHIARNADGIISMLDGFPQYPHGAEGRNADIESGSVRSWADLIADVASTSARLGTRLSEPGVDWTGTVTMLPGQRPKASLPLMRQREVEVHRADLGIGYGFADMPGEYVRRDLRLMGMFWQARKPMGLTPLPELALALDPATRLAWMMGRVEIDGLEPANLF